MNTINQMKNIIVLKDLPSNIIEEAFVILKPNAKVNIVKTTRDKAGNNVDGNEKSSEYIVKEAEMVINSYLSNTNEQSKIRSHTIKQIEHKYKKLRKFTAFLSIIFAMNIILNLVIK